MGAAAECASKILSKQPDPGTSCRNFPAVPTTIPRFPSPLSMSFKSELSGDYGSRGLRGSTGVFKVMAVPKSPGLEHERHPHHADLTFRRGQLALSSGRSIRTAEIWM